MNSAPKLHHGFRFKPIPLAVTVVLAVGLPCLAAVCALLASRVLHTASPAGSTLPWLYMQHAWQLLLALIAIAILRRFVPANYGLQWPRGKAYVGTDLVPDFRTV